MKNTKTTSITAVFVIATMVVACATPNGSGSLSQGDPCQPGGPQTSFNPQNSFVQQVILNPLAKIGGTLLATAATNYSGHYTGKLNKLLTKLVTPKKKKKKKSKQQTVNQDNQFDNQGGQPGFGFQNQVDPDTDFPIQDPSGFPSQNDFEQTQEQIDPNTGFPIDPGFGEEGQFQSGLPQEGASIEPGFEDQGEFNQDFQGNVQSRGVRQRPQISFPSNDPCEQQQTAQQYPPAGQQNQPYGNEPNDQYQGDDPYSQQQGYPQDPYGQQPSQQDPYAQQEYPQDPYGQQPPQQDPYAQQGYPQDPYGQQPPQ